MRVAICDDNQQDIERIRRYTLRMIDYAVEYVFYTIAYYKWLHRETPEDEMENIKLAELIKEMCIRDSLYTL